MTNINTVQLSDAFASYTTFVEQHHRLDNGQVTEWGQAKARQIIFIKKHVSTIRLADLDLRQIEQIIGLLARRPSRLRDGKPISLTYAKALIKGFRQFLRWLHRSDGYLWRLPEDYEARQVPVKTLASDLNGRIFGPSTYSKEELATLWSYATPWERCLMLLGLNCGFGMAEIASLKKDEVYLNQPHPFANHLDLNCKGSASWIRRIRAKTGSYGEWILWPETVSAVELLNQCNNADLSFAVVTLKGKPLMEDGSRSNKIASVWRFLNKRIQKDRPGFPCRPFSSLRKTSAHFIGSECGSDIAALFLTHSMPANHHRLDQYVNLPFAKLHEATESLRNLLSDVFDQG
jgi:hypothetical protein